MMEIFPRAWNRAEDRVLGLGYTSALPGTSACFPDTVLNNRKTVFSSDILES